MMRLFSSVFLTLLHNLKQTRILGLMASYSYTWQYFFLVAQKAVLYLSALMKSWATTDL